MTKEQFIAEKQVKIDAIIKQQSELINRAQSLVNEDPVRGIKIMAVFRSLEVLKNRIIKTRYLPRGDEGLVPTK